MTAPHLAAGAVGKSAVVGPERGAAGTAGTDPGTPVAVSSDVGRYELHAPAGDHIGEVIRRSGRPYEERLLRLLADLTPSPAATVVDVGANIGNHTVFFARRGSPVIAVEANPAALAYLERNTRPYRDLVRVWPVAAGAAAGRGHVARAATGQLGQMSFHLDPEGPIEVVTLDAIDEEVSIVKIDVEGGEEAVLAGSRRLLARSRPVVVVESWDRHHRRAVERLVQPLGYHRFPLSLCSTPTYVYLPSWSLLLRAWTSSRPLSLAASATVGRVARRLRRGG